MSSRFTELVVDCRDPDRLAEFWKGVLGYEVTEKNDDEGRVLLEGPEDNEFCVLRTRRP